MRERTKDLKGLRGLGLALVVAGISAPACGQASENGGTGGAAGAGLSAFGGSAGASATDGRSGGSSRSWVLRPREPGGAPAGSGVGGGAGRDDAGASTGGRATGQPGEAGGGAGGAAGGASYSDDHGRAMPGQARRRGGRTLDGRPVFGCLPLKCADRWITARSTARPSRIDGWPTDSLARSRERSRDGATRSILPATVASWRTSRI